MSSLIVRGSRRSDFLPEGPRAAGQLLLTFYEDGDIGNDKVWDCWRLEGPSFVWYFRGSPTSTFG